MKDLLTSALDAHGGLSRWREIEAFQLKVSIGGGLWRFKGLPNGLRDVTLRVQAHRPIVTITPFAGEARTGHFTPDRVWIEDANGGVVALWKKLGVDKDVVFVLHDWGSLLGFDWTRQHAERVQGIVYMEALVQPITWED